jgi:elongation factor Ts|tara:strand:- start:1150 stop:1974 length:825 start_codon:yes stop_codon:yes gene_type:complete
MVKVTAAEVNKLRKTTGAGMMDCKKALVEADGNFDSAIEILRKKGQKVAAKRADRESSEGVAIAIANEDNTSGIGIVLACETDFVGKNADFIDLAHKIATVGLKCNTKEELLKSNLGDISVEEKLIEQTGVIGEKIQINDFAKINAAFVGTYIHAGNKISSLVGFSENCENIEVAAKDISMQVAAMNPIALDENSVDSNIIEKEIEIAKDQLRAEGKPEEMLDKIAQGKLKRFFKDNTLIHQAFIKDSKLSVSQYLSSFSSDAKITSFNRVSIG